MAAAATHDPTDSAPPADAADRLEERLRGLIEPVVEECGLALWDLQVRGGASRVGAMRIFLDRATAGASDEGPRGVTIDECATVSRRVSVLLDVEDPIRSGYNLEVSSPGLDRQLRRPEHYQRLQGGVVRVRLHAPVGGRRTLVGTLVASDGDGFELQPEGGDEPVRLSFGDVKQANAVPQLAASFRKKPSPDPKGRRGGRKKGGRSKGGARKAKS